MATAIFSSICKEGVIITLSILILCLYPLFAIILLPLLTYRSIIKLIVQRDPKIGKMLGGQDAYFAAHKTYTNPSTVLLPFLTLSPKVDRSHVIKVLTDRLWKPTDNAGQCWFPEFTQKIVRRYGYLFWHEVDNFCLEDYVKFLNPTDPEQLVCRSQLNDILEKDLALRPFNPEKSPWEIIVVPNFQDDKDPETKSLLMFRIHHLMCDGLGTIKVWQKLSFTPWKYIVNIKSFQQTHTQSFVKFLGLVFTGPYQLLKIIYFSDDTNQWMTTFRNHATGSVINQELLIPIRKIQSVKNHFQVSFTSVVTTMMALAVTRTMKITNVKMVPSKFHIVLPTPLPGHRDSTSNHWGFVKMLVTVYKDDPVKTLKGIDKEFTKFRHSIIPFVGFYLLKIIGSLPVAMIPPSGGLIRSTCILSNFPGPLEQVDICGYTIRDCNVVATPPKGYPSAAIALSYNGYIRLRSGGDCCNLTRHEDADFLAASIGEALDELQIIAKAV